MNKVLLIFLLLWPLQSAMAQADACPEKRLFAYEQALMDGIATGDTALWNLRLDDRCLIAVEDGSTRSKKAFLAELRPLPKGYVGKIVLIDHQAVVQGDMAVTQFICDEYLELFSQHIHTQYRQTNTWRRTGSDWKIAAIQLF